MRIHLLWDASDIWGLLAARAFSSLGLGFRPVLGSEIAGGLLQRESPALLFVPGGFSRNKFRALGEQGKEEIRAYVRRGGWYFGVCGGAGLGLDTAEGLALCPWERVGYPARLQHFMSGHVRAVFAEHDLAPEGASEDAALLPVWWPGLFDPHGGEGDGRVILARYAGPGPDFRIADLDAAGLPMAVFHDWKARYGVDISPEFLKNRPGVVHGAFGRGWYTLSYSHLETPGSGFANAWFVKLLRRVGGLDSRYENIPDWDVAAMPLAWDDPDIALLCRGIEEIMEAGRAAGLFFARTPWLTGWRMGAPGMQLGSLRAQARSIAAAMPEKAAEALWHGERRVFMKRFSVFKDRVIRYLLAERLALSISRAMPELDLFAKLHAERLELFGSGSMAPHGLIKPLLPVLERLAYFQAGGVCAAGCGTP